METPTESAVESIQDLIGRSSDLQQYVLKQSSALRRHRSNSHVPAARIRPQLTSSTVEAASDEAWMPEPWTNIPQRVWDLPSLMSGRLQIAETLDDAYLRPKIFPYSIVGPAQEQTKSSSHKIKCLRSMQATPNKLSEGKGVRQTMHDVKGGQRNLYDAPVVKKEELCETESVILHTSQEADEAMQMLSKRDDVLEESCSAAQDTRHLSTNKKMRAVPKPGLHEKRPCELTSRREKELLRNDCALCSTVNKPDSAQKLSDTPDADDLKTSMHTFQLASSRVRKQQEGSHQDACVRPSSKTRASASLLYQVLLPVLTVSLLGALFSWNSLRQSALPTEAQLAQLSLPTL